MAKQYLVVQKPRRSGHVTIIALVVANSKKHAIKVAEERWSDEFDAMDRLYLRPQAIEFLDHRVYYV